MRRRRASSSTGRVVWASYSFMRDSKRVEQARKAMRAAAQQPLPNIRLDGNGFHVFCDETGQFDFSNGSLFGIAGVAGFGTQLALAERRWIDMKRQHFGGADASLHGSGEKMTGSQLAAIGEFFRATRITRFAYVMSCPPLRIEGLDAIHALTNQLIERYMIAVDRIKRVPSSLTITFELSDATSPLIAASVPGLKVDFPNGTSVPVQYGFCPKSANSPFLQMADQVAHRAQRQHRSGFDGPLLKEFTSVFPRVGAPHAPFVMIRLQEFSASTTGPRISFDYNAGTYTITGEGAMAVRITSKPIKGRSH